MRRLLLSGLTLFFLSLVIHLPAWAQDDADPDDQGSGNPVIEDLPAAAGVAPEPEDEAFRPDLIEIRIAFDDRLGKVTNKPFATLQPDNDPQVKRCNLADNGDDPEDVSGDFIYLCSAAMQRTQKLKMLVYHMVDGEEVQLIEKAIKLPSASTATVAIRAPKSLKDGSFKVMDPFFFMEPDDGDGGVGPSGPQNTDEMADLFSGEGGDAVKAKQPTEKGAKSAKSPDTQAATNDSGSTDTEKSINTGTNAASESDGGGLSLWFTLPILFFISLILFIQALRMGALNALTQVLEYRRSQYLAQGNAEAAAKIPDLRALDQAVQSIFGSPKAAPTPPQAAPLPSSPPAQTPQPTIPSPSAADQGLSAGQGSIIEGDLPAANAEPSPGDGGEAQNTSTASTDDTLAADEAAISADPAMDAGADAEAKAGSAADKGTPSLAPSTEASSAVSNNAAAQEMASKDDAKGLEPTQPAAQSTPTATPATEIAPGMPHAAGPATTLPATAQSAPLPATTPHAGGHATVVYAPGDAPSKVAQWLGIFMAATTEARSIFRALGGKTQSAGQKTHLPRGATTFRPKTYLAPLHQGNRLPVALWDHFPTAAGDALVLCADDPGLRAEMLPALIQELAGRFKLPTLMLSDENAVEAGARNLAACRYHAKTYPLKCWDPEAEWDESAHGDEGPDHWRAPDLGDRVIFAPGKTQILSTFAPWLRASTQETGAAALIVYGLKKSQLTDELAAPNAALDEVRRQFEGLNPMGRLYIFIVPDEYELKLFDDDGTSPWPHLKLKSGPSGRLSAQRHQDGLHDDAITLGHDRRKGWIWSVDGQSAVDPTYDLGNLIRQSSAPVESE